MKDIAQTLRDIAEGRMLLNVRNGVSVPAGLLVRAAEEIEQLRAVVSAAKASINNPAWAEDVLPEAAIARMDGK